MTISAELNHSLKQLKLSGIIDSIDIRNQEAIVGKLSYTDFLLLLLQDESARREQNKFDRRFKRSNLRAGKTVEQFNFDFNPKINHKLIMDLATCRFVNEKVAVLMVGPCGTGKSHLGQAIGHCAIRQGIDTIFISQTDLFQCLRRAKAVGHYDRKFRELVSVPLLIIDDFGLKPLRVPDDETFHELIAKRYEQSATLLTSNLDFTEWGNAFPNKLLGVATLDRLRHGAYQVVLEGESYRGQARPQQASEAVEV